MSDEVAAPGARLQFPNGWIIHVDSHWKGQVCYRAWRDDPEEAQWLRKPLTEFVELVQTERGAMIPHPRDTGAMRGGA